MPITEIFAFLVHPQKSVEERIPARGDTVELQGPLHGHLNAIYESSENECDIDISFDADDQQNAVRTEVISFGRHGTVETAQVLADRLSAATTRRSGTGLLFLIRGAEGANTQVLISRFPTDKAIMADERDGNLDVQFLERVFMKNRNTYKAALYSEPIGDRTFWQGKVVDRQLNTGAAADVSRYWVHEFLLSDFSVNGAYASRRLAIAIKDASTHLELTERSDLFHAVALAQNRNGMRTSASDLLDRYNLDDTIKNAVRERMGDQAYQQQFVFNRDEFGRHLSFRTIELDNGATLTAESRTFEEVFNTRVVEAGDAGADQLEISTAGRLLSDRLKKSR